MLHDKRGKVEEFKDVSMLKDPLGATVDNNSNVYVTSNPSSKIVVLEPDGRHGRQLISSDDGLVYPYGIHYNKSKKVCWLLTTMDQLPCIIRVKYYCSAIDISCQKTSISCTTKII